MPELPEVEVCRRGLSDPLQNARIVRTSIRTARLRQIVAADLSDRLDGRVITQIARRGKYLLFACQNSADRGWLIVHFGMSGNLLLLADETSAQKHGHIDFHLQTTTQRWLLRYHDPRRFGLVLWHDCRDYGSHPLLAPLGIEPLQPSFDSHWLYTHSRHRRTAIKQLLMNSRFIAGIGNIYAAEALFGAGISPFTPAGQLNDEQCQRLARAIHTTLEAAIAAGGSSIRDYVHSDGGIGGFQLQYAVYGRAGQPCPKCKTAIIRCHQNGRSSFLCPQCQS